MEIEEANPGCWHCVIKVNETQFLLPSDSFEPAYLALYRSGELQSRAKEALAGLASCQVCPRVCGCDRLLNETGVCRIGRYAWVSNYMVHIGEEDCLRGFRGSGTIFFTLCNLRCVFCQNYDISQVMAGTEVGPERLASMMIELQAAGCHNINLVTPEHVVPQILESLPIAIGRGLRLPLVYNTSAYDSVESLRLLDGVVDIYMPDFKIWDPDLAHRYLKARDYPNVARKVLAEMHRQVGVLKLDENDIARRGVLVRHLLMPGRTAGTTEIMQFLAGSLSPDVYVNIMSQYYPAGRVSGDHYPELNRRITQLEHQQGVDAAVEAGLWRFDSRRFRVKF